jgi:hypothetical protein
VQASVNLSAKDVSPSLVNSHLAADTASLQL